MRNEDLALEDLTTIADAIAAGRTTSVAATEACLARIEAWQPRTNAFLRFYREKALAQAKAMDAELAAGRSRSPLRTPSSSTPGRAARSAAAKVSMRRL